MARAFHLGAGLAGRLTDDGELSLQVMQEDRCVIKIKAFANKIDRFNQQFVEIKRAADVARDFCGGFQLKRSMLAFIQADGHCGSRLPLARQW